ncbi:MAG TPA: iron-containing redox enzyme family protein [Polyangiaceae bacterium]|nr:iron-containing redox enzyme family protein [Polyangiaceae bacterium]
METNDASEIVRRYEQVDLITHHPFLKKLRSEPVNMYHLWKLLANFQISISKTFAQRLALIASRIDDPYVRYIVTELLYDEMGSGKVEDAHVILFSNMMNAMSQWKSTEPQSWVLAPGTKFNAAMDRTYGSSDLNECLGAIVSGEIYGKQFDRFLGDEIRRQNGLDLSNFKWVTLHETLEETHADESANLAKLMPADAIDAVARGAHGLAQAAWQFLTDVGDVCYNRAPEGLS